jgi:hypothetical protein
MIWGWKFVRKVLWPKWSFVKLVPGRNVGRKFVLVLPRGDHRCDFLGPIWRISFGCKLLTKLNQFQLKVYRYIFSVRCLNAERLNAERWNAKWWRNAEQRPNAKCPEYRILQYRTPECRLRLNAECFECQIFCNSGPDLLQAYFCGQTGPSAPANPTGNPNFNLKNRSWWWVVLTVGDERTELLPLVSRLG